jgi:hypothetical protein
MKFLSVIRIFAFVLFIFLPAIGTLLFAAFILKSSWWFQTLGLSALLLNGLAVYLKPLRPMIANQIRLIAQSK